MQPRCPQGLAPARTTRLCGYAARRPVCAPARRSLPGIADHFSLGGPMSRSMKAVLLLATAAGFSAVSVCLRRPAYDAPDIGRPDNPSWPGPLVQFHDALE